jgi:hypothetical protein
MFEQLKFAGECTRIRHLSVALAWSAILLLALLVPSMNAQTCSASYAIQSSWSGAFQGAISVTNTGTTATTGWTLTWTYSGNQQITQLWNGSETQSGKTVTVTNASYNGSIAAGSTLTGIGFLANVTGTNTVPTITCTAQGSTGGGSFTLSPSASSLSVTQGTSATDTISIADTGGFTGSVTLTASGLPSGVAATFGTNPTTGSSVLTLTASSSATTGSAVITITGVSGSTTAKTTIALNVNPAQSFTLTPSASSLTLAQDASATDTITVTDLGGFSGSVELTASGLPSGVTASFGTNPTTGNSVLTLTASSSATTGSATITITGTSGSLTAAAPIALTVGNYTAFQQHFLDLYNDIHGSANGYFSSEGIPYHSVETLIAEAPDYGHETVSETYSYWVWLESLYGGLTANWTPLQTAWTSLETNMIPSAANQPTNSFYNASSPATYAPEWPSVSDYPATLTSSVAVGSDPLASQLSATYGTSNIYGMHWIIDTDNWYGYGQQEDGTTKPSYINTFQRGSMESVWLTVPQPCWDAFKYGGSNGYLDLFTAPAPYSKQWKYTNAPDADARTVQAMYWAEQYAKAQGGNSIVTGLLPKAAKMGDYLRYSFFDKYFKQLGCTSPSCPAGTGYNAAHYLLSWYYAWGGSIATSGGWAWRIGDSAAHFGYQNPVAAYALSTDTNLIPLTSQAKTDWTTSLERQLEFYRWLQSDEGAIAGGATNSWEGQYATPPTGDTTFYGMAYDWEPVYHNPPSNQWFGMQTWSMERLAEYYYITGNSKAKLVLDPWIKWVEANTTTNANGTYTIPSNLTWTGQPTLNWSATTQDWTTVPLNTSLHVTVASTTTDIGVTGSLAKALSYYSAGTAKWATTQDTTSQTLAKTLLTDVWTQYRDSIGISAPEVRTDYSNFTESVYIPSGWTGTMPNGDAINSSTATFINLRTQYKNDPAWSKVQTYLNGGSAPSFNYHRFWAQVDIASAYLVYANLFPGN